MAVAKNTLRILTLERLGEPFNQQLCRLRYTPRKFVIHQEHKVRQGWRCKVLPHACCLLSSRPVHCKAFISHLITDVSITLPLANVKYTIDVMCWPGWQSLCLSQLHAALHCCMQLSSYCCRSLSSSSLMLHQSPGKKDLISSRRSRKRMVLCR